jgi:hypothetical protein
MLELARVLGIVYEGTATGGSTTTCVDTAMEYPQDYFEDGTLWITSGDADGLCTKITAHANDTLTFATHTIAVAATNTYAAATADFPKFALKNAVLSALRYQPIMKADTSTTTAANQETYTLPTDVADVRRVEIATSTSAPYEYETNYHWIEANGSLCLYGDLPSTGYTMRLWYADYHDDIAESGSVEEGVDLIWLKWASAVNAWRWRIQQIRKDNPTATDMLNEAKTMEAQAMQATRRHPLRTLPRDPIHADW